MQDPNSLTLEEIEDFMEDTEGGNSEYTFPLQTEAPNLIIMKIIMKIIMMLLLETLKKLEKET